MIKHFTDLYNWSKEKVFVYGGIEGKPDAMFTSGDVPIYFQSIGSYANMRSASKFEVGVGNLPYYPEVKAAPQNSIIGGASLWVMAKKSNAEYKGVAKFFTFISKPEIMAFWHQGTGYLPITKAAYELTKLQGFYTDKPGLELAINQLNNKTPTPNSKGVRFGNLPQIRIIEDQTWEAILDGKISVKDGFDKMVKEGNALLRDFERVNK
jgi:sn-glycerol 3-phosphate transport system substrate-binding protein